MPRNVDPGSIKVGKGLAPEGTVEDNSLRYPERDVDPLRVHIHDPSRAHMASTIGIVDENDCFVSDEVEGALQEICSGAASGRLNGLVAGGTFVETFPHAGLTLTLVTTTEILINAGVFDASGLTVTLPAVDDIYFVYLDTDSSSPTFKTLQFTTGAPPEVETTAEVEDVLIAKVEVTTGGTVIDNYQDGRFFVRNLDRKVQYSSRQGENVDAWSEGCFATLHAFLLWMEYYGSASGTGEEQKGEVLVRGEHVLDSTLIVPTDSLNFVGDGNAVITTTVGFTDPTLIQLGFNPGPGIANILFRNITFQTNANGVTGILASNAVKLTRIRIEDCFFGGGGVYLAGGIDLTTPAGTGSGVTIKNTVVQANVGTRLSGIRNVRITDCSFQGVSASVANSVGIVMDSAATTDDVLISGCRVEDYEYGIQPEATTNLRITGCRITDVGYGIWDESGLTAIVSSAFEITDNIIDTHPTFGVSGVFLASVVDSYIGGNTIRSTRTSFAPDIPRGISYFTAATAGGLQGAPSNVRIVGNHISGFFDRNANLGTAILVAGQVANPTTHLVIDSNTAYESGIEINDDVRDFVVSNNVLDGYLDGNTNSPTTGEGILLDGSGSGGVAVRGTLTGNQVRRFGDGIIVVGDAVDQCHDLVIADNTISEIVHTQVGQTDTFGGVGTKAIGLLSVQDSIVSGNTIGFVGSATDNSGNPIVFVGDIWSLSVYVRNSNRNVVTENNVIHDCNSQGVGSLYGILYAVGAGAGAQYDSLSHTVSGNSISMADTNNSALTAVWFNLGDNTNGPHSFQELQIKNNSITGSPERAVLFSATDLSDTTAYGGQFTDVDVSGNDIAGFVNSGILFKMLGTAGQVYDNTVNSCSISNNKVVASQSDTLGQIGVGVTAEAQNNSSVVYELGVKDNDISFSSAPAAGVDNNGVLVSSANQGINPDLRRLLIGGNRITGEDAFGVQILRSGIHDVTERSGWIIDDNEVGSGAEGSLSPLRGVRVDIGASAAYDIFIRNNAIRMSADGIAGIEVLGTAGDGPYDIQNLAIDGNTILGLGGVSIGNPDGISLDTENFNLRLASISGNNVRVNGLGGPFALQMSMTNTLGTSLEVQEVSITDNLLRAGLVLFSFQSADVERFKFTDNLVRSNPGTGLAVTALSWQSTINLAAGSHAGVVISDNEISGGNSQIGVLISNVVQTEGFKISGNTVFDMTDEGLTKGVGISVALTGSADTTVVGLHVDDNQILKGPNGDPATGLQFLSTLNQLTLSNSSFSRNNFAGMDQGMSIQMGTPTLTSRYYDVVVEDNIIGPSSSDEADYPATGILFQGPTSTSLFHELSNVSVSGNKVSVRDANSAVYGIQTRFSALETTPYFVQGFSVNRNEVVIDRESGETPSSVSGILVEMTCNVRNVSVSDNKVMYRRSTIQRSENYGIRVFHNYTTTQGEEDSATNGQWIAGIQKAGVGDIGQWDFFFDTVANGSALFRAVKWVDVSVCRNSITFPAGLDSNADVVAELQEDNAALAFSHINLVGSDFIAVSVCGCNISDNVIRSGKQYRDTVGGGSSGLTLVGFFTRILNYDTGYPGGSGVSSTPDILQEGWVISGNNVTDFCRLQDPGGSNTYYGLDVRCIGRDVGAGLAWVAVVSNNVAKDAGSSSTYPMIVDGWARFGSVSVSDNANDNPRDFP